MKVMVTGTTGFFGEAVMEKSIGKQGIQEVFVLSRREVEPDLSNSPKVEIIIHKNFSAYPTTLTDRFKEAEACVWCIGGKVQDFPDIETARDVRVD